MGDGAFYTSTLMGEVGERSETGGGEGMFLRAVAADIGLLLQSPPLPNPPPRWGEGMNPSTRHSLQNPPLTPPQS